MKHKAKKVLASSLVSAMMLFAMPLSTMAQSDHELAPAGDPFWTIFEAMSSPGDTPSCVAAAMTYVNSQDISVEQKQGEIAGYTAMCDETASMPSNMQSALESEGVTSNLFDNTSDWHRVNNLYFKKEGLGKIQFNNTIDFMSYRFMSFMRNFENLVQFSDGYISLNASMMSDMKEYGTQLTMFGLPFAELPDIYVTDASGTTMHKATDSDVSGVNYNQITGELTFNAAHFSAFKAVTKGSKVKTMKITKVTPNKVKYSAKKRTFKLTVRGKGFYKKRSVTACTLGMFRSMKAKASKNGKNAVCTFDMSLFSTLGTYPLAVSIDGNGEVTKTNAVRIR